MLRADWALGVEPRRWQSEALDLWSSEMRGVVRIVTGGGKTVFAQLCMLKFRERYPDGVILILVPTTSLLDQWQAALRVELGVQPEQIGCYSGEERTRERRPISIAVINTARDLSAGLVEGAVAMLVVDECHRAGSPINARALNGEFAATLGLTATPERQYDDGFERYIEPKLGSIIFEYDYTKAHEDRVISDFDLINVRVQMLADEDREYKKLTRAVMLALRKAETDPEAQFRAKRLLQQRASVSAKAAMRLPVAAKIVDAHRGERTLLFHERVDAADALLKIVTARHHSATIYHSKIGPAIRRDNLFMFRRGICDVLLCCRALDEGINVPETRVAVIAASTASTRQRIQRLGRALRPAQGKERALIYTLYATDAEEARLKAECEKLGEITTVTWRTSRLESRG